MTFEDTLWSGLADSYAQLPMALTAENLAEQHEITRQDCDQFALRSQQRWKEAAESGAFNEELAHIKVKGKIGDESFQVDSLTV